MRFENETDRKEYSAQLSPLIDTLPVSHDSFLAGRRSKTSSRHPPTRGSPQGEIILRRNAGIRAPYRWGLQSQVAGLKRATASSRR